MYYPITRGGKLMPDDTLIASLCRHIGQTVTIFTTSGGLSGSGFTGTLAGVDANMVKLITAIGAPPACPVGSACTGPMQGNFNGFGFANGFNSNFTNWLGSITEIPLCKIASFTHNAIN